jgi:hypothetical protein
MELAAAVAADGRERPVFISSRNLRAPGFAQDRVDELGARVNEDLHGFVRAESLDQLGVGVAQLGAKGVRRVLCRGQPLRQVRETQPRRRARDRRFGRLDVLVEGGWHLAVERRAQAALAQREDLDAGFGHEHRVLPLCGERMVLGDDGPAVA